MIKRFKRNQEQKKQYRINERIFATTLRVLDAEGKQIGILSKFEALRMAGEQNADVVEIVPNAQPPVAKIIDYQKFLYQEEKKKQEEKRKTKTSETKEVRLGPFMSDNDLQVMMRRGREFLEAGDKVRLVLRFRGRQIIHPEFGRATMQKMIEGVSDISKVDREMHMEGNQLISLLSVERNKKHEKEKDQQSSDQTVQNNENR